MEQITFIVGRNPLIKQDEIAIKVDDFTKQVNDSHFKIICIGNSKSIKKNRFYIEDLNSSIGTYVSGSKITSKIELVQNSLITFGNSDIRFSLNNIIIKNTLKNRNSIDTNNENLKRNINASIDKASDFTNELSNKRDNQLIDTSNQKNKVVNVNLKGGILGILANSPQNTLNKRIKKENANGWKVIQVIPASSGNILLLIFRIVLLVITVFLFTTANGYYIIMEKE
jgi:pSer/pThr/pTyr-binding forkhead associated (FHA) protein